MDTFIYFEGTRFMCEGVSWSVSEKYILACDSMTLFIKPTYYDFFTRSQVPYKHYWPISKQNMCEDIKYAVDRGNTHPEKVINLSINSFHHHTLMFAHIYKMSIYYIF